MTCWGGQVESAKNCCDEASQEHMRLNDQFENSQHIPMTQKAQLWIAVMSTCGVLGVAIGFVRAYEVNLPFPE